MVVVSIVVILLFFSVHGCLHIGLLVFGFHCCCSSFSSVVRLVLLLVLFAKHYVYNDVVSATLLLVLSVVVCLVLCLCLVVVVVVLVLVYLINCGC